jgi:Ca2+/Na+ antiporter
MPTVLHRTIAGNLECAIDHRSQRSSLDIYRIQYFFLFGLLVAIQLATDNRLPPAISVVLFFFHHVCFVYSYVLGLRSRRVFHWSLPS